MNTKSIEYMRNLCRTCMKKFSRTQRETAINNKQQINDIPIGWKDTSLMELLQLVHSHIKVEINDNLPTLICSGCIKKLLMAHEFIEKYKNADKQLRNMLKEVKAVNSSCKQTVDSMLKEVKVNPQEKSIIASNDQTEKMMDKEIVDDIYELTKLEVDRVNIEELKKELNDWPELDDEPLQDISMEEECKEYFTNPYSDEEEVESDKDLYFSNPYSDSGDEWTPSDTRERRTCIKIATRKEKIKNKTNNERMITKRNSNSKNISSNKKQEDEKKIKKQNEKKPQLPVENEMNVGSFPCQKCDTVFDNERLLQEHLRCHQKYARDITGLKTFKCEICGKAYTQKSYFNYHMRVHQGQKPNLCIECGKSFKDLNYLNIHMLYHKGEKNVQCPQCPKKFICKSNLHNHMKLHTKEKPYVCETCGSAFRMAYTLKLHNLRHKNIRKFPCELCNKKFVTAEQQRCHMRTHTGEKPYRCKYCEKAFAQSGDHIKHLKKHLGENVYQCEQCPLRFPMARNLRAHFATHNDDDKETRARNIKAREEAQRKLHIKLGIVSAEK